MALTTKGVEMIFKQRGYPLLLSCAAFIIFSLPFAARPQNGNPMDFTLVDLDGNRVRLVDLAEGKPLLLYFWATWCKPCRMVQSQVSALAEKYKGRLTVLGINVGGVDSLKSVNRYRKRHNILYPLLLDSDNVSVKAYSVFAIPTVILLNQTGKILFRDNEAPTDLQEFLPG
jgi:thiol-disulfide isomerase/thioredoxin